MAKIKFENITEGLSVPAFYMAYRELGDKYKLWGKGLEELVPFFDNLSAKNLRRVLIAFGIRAILNDQDRALFYAGGEPGLLLLDFAVPVEALKGESGRMYCAHIVIVVLMPDFLTGPEYHYWPPCMSPRR